MSWFPARTETFILYEILELQRRGMDVEIYPLLGRKEGASHPGAEPLIARANYRKYLSKQTLSANWYWMRTSPRRYFGAWWKALLGNWRSPGFLARLVVVLPKAALMAKELQEKAVEHVHAHWATHPTLAAFTIRELTGIPYSFTAHAHDLYVDRSMLEEKLSSAKFAITISEYNRKLLKKWYGEGAAEKTAIVHCGIDARVFRPKDATQKNDVFTMVCIASLRDYKGHPYLIDACKQLKDRGRKFTLLLVGDGEDRAAIEQRIAEAGLSSEIKLLGHLPQDEVSRILRSADVAVQPSIVTKYGKMEGIPVALMEALACEVPVVATNISGIPELVRHEETGLLVPEKDARYLADAIERLMTDEDTARRLGRAGRELVLAEFDLSSNSDRLFRMLTSGAVEHATQFVPSQVEGREADGAAVA